MVQSKASKKSDDVICAHCRQPFKGKTVAVGRDVFCCRGCAAAWAYVHELGLASFYNLMQCAGAETEAASPSQDGDRLEIFDDPLFQQAFVTVADYSDSDHRQVHVASLSLSGLTCFACVWLCEQAVSRAFAGARIEVNLSRGTAKLFWNRDNHKLSELILLLKKLGFNPAPQAATDSPGHRRELVQLGVAVVCAMNVMGFALAEYLAPSAVPGDLDPFYFHLFRWLSLIVALPAVIYGALPFYEASLRFARQRRVSIDQAITFSIVVSFAFSVWNTVMGTGPIYFDSICGGIALLLGGRIIQKLVLRRADDAIRKLYRPADAFARVARPGGVSFNEGREETMPVSQIQVGDHLRVLPGELIPVSGRVVGGSGEVSAERMTGEPGFSAAGVGSAIIGGSTNGFAPLIIEANEDGRHAWYQAAQKTIDAMLGERSRFTVLTDNFATWFFAAVVGFAMLAVSYWWGLGADQAFSRAVAIVLIACPCAFGIAAPIAMAAGAARALKDGVVFRNPTAIERIAAVKKAYFDKTGTLTAGDMNVVEVKIATAVCERYGVKPEMVAPLVAALAEHSSHQWAIALRAWAVCAQGANASRPVAAPASGTFSECTPNPNLEKVHEVFGKGLQADWEGHSVKLGSQAFASGQVDRSPYSTYLAVDGDVLASFRADDALLPDAPTCIAAMRQLKIQVALLSGDKGERTGTVAAALGLEEFAGELSPDDKLSVAAVSRPRRGRFVAAAAPAAMIGNGFNDSLALAGAFAGVAVYGAAPAAREASDVYLAEPGINRVAWAFAHAQTTMKTLWWAYGFAGLYNLTGALLAFNGRVSPGVAAALMPIASIAIVRIATLDMKRFTKHNFQMLLDQRSRGWKSLWSSWPSASGSRL